MSPSPSLLNTFDIRSGASAWLLFGSSECVLGLSYPISSRVRASSCFEKSLHSFTSLFISLYFNTLSVNKKGVFAFTSASLRNWKRVGVLR